jgi:4-diphosphocytidyl-2-C-methyl-D-erythritol kinase
VTAAEQHSAVETVDTAPAKVNLTLRVLGRRPDGYHDIESLVAFADVSDRLSFVPDNQLKLTVIGPGAGQTGEDAENLVLKAARALAARIPGLALGAFCLQKNLPVAAGLGGGSSDAAAALRLLARANGLAAADPRLYEAARATGADVPVCLDPRARLMRGVGDDLSAPLELPRLCALLVNPGVALATKLVFSRWAPSANHSPPVAAPALAKLQNCEQLLAWLAGQANDLEAPAIALAPAIADALNALRALDGCRLARMSGSGATCFALFSSGSERAVAAKALRAKFFGWWITEAELGAIATSSCNV